MLLNSGTMYFSCLCIFYTFLVSNRSSDKSFINSSAKMKNVLLFGIRNELTQDPTTEVSVHDSNPHYAPEKQHANYCMNKISTAKSPQSNEASLGITHQSTSKYPGMQFSETRLITDAPPTTSTVITAVPPTTCAVTYITPPTTCSTITAVPPTINVNPPTTCTTIIFTPSPTYASITSAPPTSCTTITSACRNTCASITATSTTICATYTSTLSSSSATFTTVKTLTSVTNATVPYTNTAATVVPTSSSLSRTSDLSEVDSDSLAATPNVPSTPMIDFNSNAIDSNLNTAATNNCSTSKTVPMTGASTRPNSAMAISASSSTPKEKPTYRFKQLSNFTHISELKANTVVNLLCVVTSIMNPPTFFAAHKMIRHTLIGVVDQSVTDRKDDLLVTIFQNSRADVLSRPIAVQDLLLISNLEIGLYQNKIRGRLKYTANTSENLVIESSAVSNQWYDQRRSSTVHNKANLKDLRHPSAIKVYKEICEARLWWADLGYTFFDTESSNYTEKTIQHPAVKYPYPLPEMISVTTLEKCTRSGTYDMFCRLVYINICPNLPLGFLVVEDGTVLSLPTQRKTFKELSGQGTKQCYDVVNSSRQICVEIGSRMFDMVRKYKPGMYLYLCHMRVKCVKLATFSLNEVPYSTIVEVKYPEGLTKVLKGEPAIEDDILLESLDSSLVTEEERGLEVDELVRSASKHSSTHNYETNMINRNVDSSNLERNVPNIEASRDVLPCQAPDSPSEVGDEDFEDIEANLASFDAIPQHEPTASRPAVTSGPGDVGRATEITNMQIQNVDNTVLQTDLVRNNASSIVYISSGLDASPVSEQDSAPVPSQNKQSIGDGDVIHTTNRRSVYRSLLAELTIDTGPKDTTERDPRGECGTCFHLTDRISLLTH